MGQSAAKGGDRISAMDNRAVTSPSGVTATLPVAFSGLLSDGLSANVRIMGRPAATVGSTAQCNPPQKTLVLPGTLAVPLPEIGTVAAGSATVRINGRPAARAGDAAQTCNEPPTPPVGQVVADGTVSIG